MSVQFASGFRGAVPSSSVHVAMWCAQTAVPMFQPAHSVEIRLATFALWSLKRCSRSFRLFASLLITDVRWRCSDPSLGSMSKVVLSASSTVLTSPVSKGYQCLGCWRTWTTTTRPRTLFGWKGEPIAATSLSMRRTSQRASCGSRTSYTTMKSISTENAVAAKKAFGISGFIFFRLPNLL